MKESKKKSLKNLKSKRKMSALEKLPTELLQHIFLYCLDLNLPRASPILAGNLSSPSIYSQTIIAAFWPTWDAWHGKDRNRTVDKDLSGGDVNLQVSSQLSIYTRIYLTLTIQSPPYSVVDGHLLMCCCRPNKPGTKSAQHLGICYQYVRHTFLVC